MRKIEGLGNAHALGQATPRHEYARGVRECRGGLYARPRERINPSLRVHSHSKKSSQPSPRLPAFAEMTEKGRFQLSTNALAKEVNHERSSHCRVSEDSTVTFPAE